MFGYTIIVSRQANGGALPAEWDSKEGARLAIWETGSCGWLDELVTMGQAVNLGGAGYPFRYTGQACHLLPAILAGPPAARGRWSVGLGDVITEAWNGETAVENAATESCEPHEWLLIEAWDVS